MKILFTITFFILSLTALSTHYLTYYVYYETEYSQGPWSKIDLLENSNYKYLAPEQYEDLFGSVDADLVHKMLSRLKDKKPDTYNWNYDITIRGDTVILTPKEPVKEKETVKNEITATLTLNNFNVVVFHFEGGKEILSINDLTLPYFDLVTEQRVTESIDKKEAIQKDSINNQVQNENTISNDVTEKENESNPLLIWLVISAILNFVLIVLLIRNIQKKKI